MGKFIDLTGQSFTFLKVLKRAPNKGNHVMWLCLCICGKEKIINGNDLRMRKTKGCGNCTYYAPRKQIQGKRFGRLTVTQLLVGERSPGIDSRPLWEARCECGKFIKTTLHALNPGGNRKGIQQCSDCNKYEAENRLVGKVYYYLTVSEFSHVDKWGSFIWKCFCRCGNIVFVSTTSLEQSSTKSCGCYTKERLRKNGKSKTVLYRVWNHARRRCHLASDKAYKRYGARGIRMCQLWLEDFESFETWAFSNEFQPGLQLDRIDVDGGYYPENCQFVTKNCNSAFTWIDKMVEEELIKVEQRIAQRRFKLLNK